MRQTARYRAICCLYGSRHRNSMISNWENISLGFRRLVVVEDLVSRCFVAFTVDLTLPRRLVILEILPGHCPAKELALHFLEAFVHSTMPQFRPSAVCMRVENGHEISSLHP
jgi:hypothetical protein